MPRSGRAASQAASRAASSAGPSRGALLPRALLALALLAGYHLVAPLILAALALADLFLLRGSQPYALTSLGAYAGSVAVTCSLVRVVYLTRGGAQDRHDLPGVALTPAEQPELWQRMGELAQSVGTATFAEIRLIPDANAMVTEEPRLLGLRHGKRRLFLGTPLLLGLSEAELDAVLAHELGHYANGDTRLAATVWAARGAVERTVGTLNERSAAHREREAAEAEAKAARRRARGKPAPVTAGASRGADHYLSVVYTAYAKLCLRCTEGVSRRQEYAADLVAVRIAGRRSTADALRHLAVLSVATDLYLHRYPAMGWDAGFLPPPGQVHGGLAHLLADEARRRELDELAPRLADQHGSPHDIHPPLAERVATIEALPDDGRPLRGTAPAVGLLRAPHTVLAALEEAELGPDVRTAHRVPWHELPYRAHRAAQARTAEPLLQATADVAAARGATLHGPPAVGTLLDLVDAGLLPEIAALLPRSAVAERSTGRATREFARTAFRSRLRALTVVALADTGHIRWELSWSGAPVRQIVSEGLGDTLEAALDAVIAAPPATAPLRALLDSAPLPQGGAQTTTIRRLP
ncbi:M48 family metalloprotease [Actinacidiphila acidipaludis]|uniref:M48 family metallopeptidase n=1 Tax=Actinacidiphila acidipaludis TaxID=2873382 RepID=A0ABS7PZ81_9ACTN|nr:M48 family metallopeptidase [Streptomyces acidipaludis]MBY8876202.1 M48 family metallopeptidase [Streptomyces acidipaludis]